MQKPPYPPESVLSSFPLATSHSLILPALVPKPTLEVATCLPSGLNATPMIGAHSSRRVQRSAPFAVSQILSSPGSLVNHLPATEASSRPSGLNATLTPG